MQSGIDIIIVSVFNIIINVLTVVIVRLENRLMGEYVLPDGI